MNEPIKKTYAFHHPSEQSKEKIAKLRQVFTDLDNLLQELAPNSRERACALTNLETAAMWAVKAVVINDPASQVE